MSRKRRLSGLVLNATENWDPQTNAEKKRLRKLAEALRPLGGDPDVEIEKLVSILKRAESLR